MNENDQLREDLQTLMERFAKAGWVDRSLISSNPCRVDFTPLGTQRMFEIAAHLRDLEASGLEPTALSAAELGVIFQELLPPSFSKSEFKTLLGLVEMYHQKR